MTSSYGSLRSVIGISLTKQLFIDWKNVGSATKSATETGFETSVIEKWTSQILRGRKWTKFFPVTSMSKWLNVWLRSSILLRNRFLASYCATNTTIDWLIFADEDLFTRNRDSFQNLQIQNGCYFREMCFENE